MKLLLAILFPPGYFFAVGRPAAGVVHFIIWCISIPLFFVFFLGMFIWFFQAMLATWDLRRVLQQEQAMAIADKMAERFVVQPSAASADSPRR